MTIKDASREIETNEEMFFNLDPSKNLKEIDFTDKAGAVTNKGIYALEGNHLKLCYGGPGKDRPTKFATKAESGLFLLVLKWAKP